MKADFRLNTYRYTTRAFFAKSNSRGSPILNMGKFISYFDDRFGLAFFLLVAALWAFAYVLGGGFAFVPVHY